jgi:hypothetical protein
MPNTTGPEAKTGGTGKRNSLFLDMRKSQGIDKARLSLSPTSFYENSLLFPVTPCFRVFFENRLTYSLAG